MLFPLFSKWHLTKNESRGALAASQIERSGRPIRPVPRSPASCFSFTLENFGAGSAARFDYACSVLRLHHKSLSSFLSLSRCGRRILTPPRRRAFWPGGGPFMHSSRPLRDGSSPAALPALLHASHLFGTAFGSACEAGRLDLQPIRRLIDRVHIDPDARPLVE